MPIELPGRSHDMSSGLLRQRRNLLITSMTMLFMHFSQANINAASLVVLQVTFGRPEAVIYFLWLLQVYFLVRYYQYFRQEQDLKILDEFYEKLRTLTFQKIHRMKLNVYPNTEKYGGEYDFRNMKKVGLCAREVECQVRVETTGIAEERTCNVDIRNFSAGAILAWLHVILNTTYITYYFLPFIVAFTAMWIKRDDLLSLTAARI